MSKEYNFQAVQAHHLQLERLRKRGMLYNEEIRRLQRKQRAVYEEITQLKKDAPKGANQEDRL